MVTERNTCFNIKELYVFLTVCTYIFHANLRINSDNFLNNINLLICIGDVLYFL
jgi:hypothetical protein